MKDLSVVVYTMQGCPFCQDFKDMLQKEGIEFFDRDIDKHKQEYDIFSEITKNDMIPALLIIEGDDKSHESFLYAQTHLRLRTLKFHRTLQYEYYTL